jgi:hypothetical protein
MKSTLLNQFAILGLVALGGLTYVAQKTNHPSHHASASAAKPVEVRESLTASPALSQPQLIICPPNVTLNLGAGECDMVYNYTAPLNATLQSGLPSGSAFPIGVTTNTFKNAQNETCSFTVAVQAFPNPIQSLVCNDMVNISLDASCSAFIAADQMLEGGPYGCYDNYIVELDKVAPFGNMAGPWVPAVVDSTDIGKSYAARVVDPATGNSCWGMVTIEDKLAPVFESCPSDTVNCGSSLIALARINNALPVVVFSSTTQSSSVKSSEVNSLATHDDILRAQEDGNGLTFIVDVPSRLRININAIEIPFRIKFGNPDPIPNGDVEIHYKKIGDPTYIKLPGCYEAQANHKVVNKFDLVPIKSKNCDPKSKKVAPPISINLFGGQYSFFITGVEGSTNYALNHISGEKTTCNKDGVKIISDQIQTSYRYNNFPTQGVTNPVAFIGKIKYTSTLKRDQVNQVITTDCSPIVLDFHDELIPLPCSSGFEGVVQRRWTAVDESGNSSTCIQSIYIKRPSLDDVILPPNYDDITFPAISCNEGEYPTPDYLQGLSVVNPGGDTTFFQGRPQLDDGSLLSCGVSDSYNDEVIPVCDGTYKIIREWKLVDWCTGEISFYNQLIKVYDHTAPSIECPADFTVSTDAFTCCAIVDLPDVITSDACSRVNNASAKIIGFDPITQQAIGTFNVGGYLEDFPSNNYWLPDTMVTFGTTPCLPIGTHIVTYTVVDDCGNSSTCSFNLTVVDNTPPLAACDEFTQVSLGLDGMVFINATTFDDGSYDNCAPVSFKARRMDNNDCQPSDKFFDQVKFCCDDIDRKSTRLNSSH